MNKKKFKVTVCAPFVASLLSNPIEVEAENEDEARQKTLERFDGFGEYENWNNPQVAPEDEWNFDIEEI